MEEGSLDNLKGVAVLEAQEDLAFGFYLLQLIITCEGHMRIKPSLLTASDHFRSNEYAVGVLCCGSERWFLYPIAVRVCAGFESM